MSKRIFIAISISENLQEEILDWEKDYQNLPVRWLEGKNLHITLIPPWEEGSIEKVKMTLKTLEGKIGPFEVVFERVCYGPRKDELRLIWAEGAAPKEIQNLETRALKALSARPSTFDKSALVKAENVLGKRQENRQFKLHLTLARFRPKDFVRFPINPVRSPPCQRGTAAAAQRRLTSNGIKKLDEKVFWRQEVRSFVLMESHLLPNGSDYEVLEEIKL